MLLSVMSSLKREDAITQVPLLSIVAYKDGNTNKILLFGVIET